MRTVPIHPAQVGNRNAFAAYVFGDSMEAKLEDGDIVFAIRNAPPVRGQLCIIELKTGETYRGNLIESEDNMNCQLSNVTLTSKDGKRTNLEQCFIRGSKIRFLVRARPRPAPPRGRGSDR